MLQCLPDWEACWFMPAGLCCAGSSHGRMAEEGEGKLLHSLCGNADFFFSLILKTIGL